MFSSLSDKLTKALGKFRNKGKLTPADIKEGMREIKLALLEADVSFKVTKEFVRQVSERAVGAEVLESLVPSQQIVKIVNEELVNLMGKTQAKLEISPKPPTVIMMCGLQGAGKTTHSAKLAALYKKQGKNPLLVACDIYRPAAIKQLQVVGEQLGIPVFEGIHRNAALNLITHTNTHNELTAGFVIKLHIFHLFKRQTVAAYGFHGMHAAIVILGKNQNLERFFRCTLGKDQNFIDTIAVQICHLHGLLVFTGLRRCVGHTIHGRINGRLHFVKFLGTFWQGIHFLYRTHGTAAKEQCRQRYQHR